MVIACCSGAGLEQPQGWGPDKRGSSKGERCRQTLLLRWAESQWNKVGYPLI